MGTICKICGDLTCQHTVNYEDIRWPTIKIIVKDIKGHCVAGHKVGDVFEIYDDYEKKLHWQTKGYLCPAALSGMFPFLVPMRYGVNFPWAGKGGMDPLESKESFLTCCNDVNNLVTFEVIREGKVQY